MPRKLLRKILPSAGYVRNLSGMSRFTHWLRDENLWHINRRSVSLGAAIGLFFCYWPIPFQMVPTLVAAMLIRANLPISIGLVWISNPLTMLPMYTPAYMLGSWILGERVPPVAEMTFATLGRNLEALWLGCLIFGSVLALAGWALVRMYWHWSVQYSWHLRRKRRRCPRNTSD